MSRIDLIAYYIRTRGYSSPRATSPTWIDVIRSDGTEEISDSDRAYAARVRRWAEGEGGRLERLFATSPVAPHTVRAMCSAFRQYELTRERSSDWIGQIGDRLHLQIVVRDLRPRRFYYRIRGWTIGDNLVVWSGRDVAPGDQLDVDVRVKRHETIGGIRHTRVRMLR